MQNVTSDFSAKFSVDYFDSQSFPLCLAPMVGLSHFVLRQVIQDYMPTQSTTFWPTEMLNTKRIPNEILGANSETYVHLNEKNIVPQILGNEEYAIAESIKKLSRQWNIAGIDINMGCPVQKALRHNYGVALMGDVDYAAAVVNIAYRASQQLEKPIPVSVKLRAVGSSKTVSELLKFTDQLVAAGASWLTLHPRTAEQKRRGQSDWTQIQVLKKHSTVPIIGNGDIQTVDDIFQMITETGVDKVMAGRAFAAKPWMAWQLAEKLKLDLPENLASRSAPKTDYEEGAEYGLMLLKFIRLAEEKFIHELKLSENLVLRKIQFFVRTTHVWLEFGHTLMSVVNRAKTITELQDNVNSFFKNEQRMFQRTELRQ